MTIPMGTCCVTVDNLVPRTAGIRTGAFGKENAVNAEDGPILPAFSGRP